MTHPKVGHPVASTAPTDRSGFVPIHDRGGRWRVQAAWRARLIGPDAPDWFRLHDDRRATRVKQGRGRSVWRVELGDVAVFAKVMQPSGLTSRMKALLIGNPARREWEALMACAARGVPVPEALGWGMQASGGAYALITLGIEPARTFLDAWMEAMTTKEGRRGRTLPLIRSAARLFATAHERGVWHRDAHPGNVLVRATGVEIEVLFTDLLGARMSSGACDWPASMRSLAQFDQRMRRVASRVERRELLREYLKLRRPGEAIPRASLRELLNEKKCAQWQHAIRLARKWDRRLRGDGRYFAKVRLAGGWSGMVVLRLERRVPDLWPRIKDRPLEEWKWVLPQVAQTQPSDGALVAAELEWEHVEARSLRERLAWTLHGSPTQTDFFHAHRGWHRDFHWKPMLLGYLQRRRWGLVDACVLLHPIEGVKDTMVAISK